MRRFQCAVFAVTCALLLGCVSGRDSTAAPKSWQIRSPNPSRAGQTSELSDGPPLVDFTVLSGFDYQEPPAPRNIAQADLEAVPPVSSPLPAAVQALDGQSMRLQGFMVPLDLEDGRVTTFLLLADHKLCCGIGDPRVNDMVEVTSIERVDFHMDYRVEVTGRLEVGAEFEHGYLSSLYRMNAASLQLIGGGPPSPKQAGSQQLRTPSPR